MNKSIKITDYIPQRIGLIYIPPIIVIEYLIPSQQKVFQHKIKLLKLTEKSDVDDFVRYIKKRHQLWVEGKVSDDNLENLISKLKEKIAMHRKSKSDTTRVYVQQKPETQISTFSQAQVQQVKAPLKLNTNFQTTTFTSSINSLSSNKSQSKIAQMGFEEIEDDEDNQEQEVEEEYAEDFDEESVASAQEQSQSQSYDYDTLNLNKMTPEEVQKHKNKMDVVYKQNIKRPGDSGYQYDVQKNFQQTKQSDWDEED